MQKTIALLLSIGASHYVVAQQDAFAKSFSKAKNDSSFVIEHSSESVQNVVFEAQFNSENSPEYMKQILKDPIGTVVGPVVEYGKNVYYKIIAADTTTAMHAAHVFVSHSMHAEGESEKIILDAYDKLKKGATWTSIVDEYSEDGTVQSDGDLGWFTEGMMVKPFNDACLKMKKGEKTIVMTEFGWHIIWMKSDLKRTRKAVTCMRLVAK
jgi:peptidyl-prolyl cis-trans isomerase D